MTSPHDPDADALDAALDALATEFEDLARERGLNVVDGVLQMDPGRRYWIIGVRVREPKGGWRRLGGRP